MKINIFLVLIIVSVFSCVSIQAQELQKFDLLMQKMRHVSSFDALDDESGFIDCRINPPREKTIRISEVSQWIYNGNYAWRTLQAVGGQCLYLSFPEERWLSVEEANLLLQASRYEFTPGDYVEAGLEVPAKSTEAGQADVESDEGAGPSRNQDDELRFDPFIRTIDPKDPLRTIPIERDSKECAACEKSNAGTQVSTSDDRACLSSHSPV